MTTKEATIFIDLATLWMTNEICYVNVESGARKAAFESGAGKATTGEILKPQQLLLDKGNEFSISISTSRHKDGLPPIFMKKGDDGFEILNSSGWNCDMSEKNMISPLKSDNNQSGISSIRFFPFGAGIGILIVGTLELDPPGEE